MTRKKDQKRLIRSRMGKTGESYTAARAIVVGREDRGRYAAPRKEWPALAGVSDQKVKEKTDRTWAQWVAALDKAGAHKMSHRDIARHLSATYEEVNPWWAQSITVGYERIRGLRDVGQQRGGTYEANKSRTFGVDVSTLYRACRDARRRRKWLPEGVTKVRTAIENKSIRVDWHNGTQVNLYFVPKSSAKSTLAVQHAKLPSKREAEQAKAFWGERLDALKEVLR